MDAKTGDALAAAGWRQAICTWCGLPRIEFSGDTYTGITRIDCRDCGARFTRMPRSQAVEWAGLQLNAALSMGLARQIKNAKILVDIYLAGVDGVNFGEPVWVMTREGSGGDEHDDIPF